MSLMVRTLDRSVSFPVAAIVRMMPGCGKIAMSGSWLACTRVLISELKFDVGESFSVTPFLLAQSLMTFWKSSDWLPVKPYMISMLLLVFLLPPLPPPELRQPEVRAATAVTVKATRTADLMRMCTPSDTVWETTRPPDSGRTLATGTWRPVRESPGPRPARPASPPGWR